jgi:hypothetical protein
MPRDLGIRAVGGLCGVLAAALPFIAVLAAAGAGLIPEWVLLPLSPWIAFGLPIGAVAGLIVGALLAPSAWSTANPEWWLAGKVSLVAWVVGIAIGGAWGFLIGSGDIRERVALGGFIMMAAMPMLIIAFPAALAWLMLMRLAAAAVRRIAPSA